MSECGWVGVRIKNSLARKRGSERAQLRVVSGYYPIGHSVTYNLERQV